MATNKDEIIDLAISPITLDPRPATPGPGIFVRNSPAAGTAGPPAGDNSKEKPSPDADSPAPEPQHSSGHHRFLTPTEWARVAHGLGAICPNDNGETHQVVHPTSCLWPPKGLPDGLYRDIVTQRSKYSIGYTILNALHWIFLTLQIAVGASLTALGSSGLASPSFDDENPRDAPITILAAINTVVAGLLALMHNSGLPERYRKDMNEFDKIKNHVREILDTGIVGMDQTVDDVLDECFTLFQTAKDTVTLNKPESYNTPNPEPGKQGNPSP